MSRRTRGGLLAVASMVLAGAAVGGALWYAKTEGAAHPVSPAVTASTGSGAAAPASAARSTVPSLPTAVAEPSVGATVAVDSPAASTGGRVSVLLTYAGWQAPAGVSSMDGQTGSVRVTGLVSGVIENGGTCVVTLTQGAAVITGRASGLADAKSTDCAVSLTDPRITPGAWSAVLTYRSSTSRGTSAAATVQVTPR